MKILLTSVMSLLICSCGNMVLDGLNSINTSNINPQIPEDFHAAIVSNNSVKLSWEQAIDPDKDECTYKIFISTSHDSDFTEIETVIDTSLTINNLTENTNYFFKIIAVDSKEAESNMSEAISVFTDTYYFRVFRGYENDIQTINNQEFPYIDNVCSLKLLNDGGFLLTTKVTTKSIESANIPDDIILEYAPEGDQPETLCLTYFNPEGTINWSNSFNFTTNELPIFAKGDSVQRNDGGFIAAVIYDWEEILTLIGIDASGNPEWSKQYSGIPDFHEMKIIKTSNNNFLLLIPSHILKVDANGELLSAINTGLSLNQIIQTSDGGFICVGRRGATQTVVILKLNSDWTIAWQKKAYSSGNDGYNGTQNIVEVNNGYIITCDIYNGIQDLSQFDICAMHINSTGSSITWAKAYGSILDDNTHNLTKIDNNKIIITGSTNSTEEGVADIWLLQIDNSGNITKEKRYGNSESDIPRSLAPLNNNDVLIAGTTQSWASRDKWDSLDEDMFIMRLNNNLHLPNTGLRVVDTNASVVDISFTLSSTSYTAENVTSSIVVQDGTFDASTARDYYMIDY